MSLRNQPYLPLYVQDFMTDEKLAECSAKATGVYIRLMCLMHKSEEYGKILLKQKDKQTDNQIENFAIKVAKFFPYDYTTVFNALNELVNEAVLIVEGDYLIQKRMVKDAEISEKRASAGSKGGKKTTGQFAKAKSQAKPQANSEIEYEDESDTSTSKKEKKKAYRPNIKLTPSENDRLVEELGQEFVDACYDYLSDWKIEKGKSSKDDNRTIRRWVIDAVTNKKGAPVVKLQQRPIKEVDYDEFYGRPPVKSAF